MHATNVCRRDGDVLLRTNTLEDELHTRVPLLLRAARLTTLGKISGSPSGSPSILAGVPWPPNWSPKLINQ